VRRLPRFTPNRRPSSLVSSDAAMVQSLVLNATNEPLSVVSARRAIVLLVREKAELVHSRDQTWSSEHLTLPVPTVVRLRRYVRVPYLRRTPLNRRAVFARDLHRCQYCSASAENLDHVVPRSRGGTHTWENVVAACRRCNTRKGNHTPVEAGMLLVRDPKAPRAHGWLLIGLTSAPHPSWDEYLTV
jgi:5-methylcytosine-specific restriction endonuclease McrA